MGNNPSDFKGPKNPVEQVLWDDCQQFLGKLNAKSAAGAGKFQLPTEAQWEYACRAGSKTRYCFGDDEKQLGEYAWYGKNSDGKTHPVGEKKPNAWGLYDMHGNVWEWCQDWWKDGYYKESPVDDPTGPLKGSYRVLRGGSWSLPARYRRSGVPPLRRARVPFRRLPGLACLPSSGGQAERASNTNPLTCCEHVQREPTAPPVAVEQDCARSTARWQDFNWVACSARFWSVACGATRSLVPGA